MASSGRIPLTKLEKAKRKASRDYRKLIAKRNLSYDDMFEKRVGNKNMGRKPVSKAEQVRRAKIDFLESLFEHRAAAREDSISLPSIRALLREYKFYRANDSAGRKGSDRVITLLKYIGNEQAKLDKAILEPCPMEIYNGRGRKPMSKSEKEVHYQQKISVAQIEIDELVKTAPKSQQIYYDLRKARLELRSRKKALTVRPDEEMVQHYLKESECLVADIENKYNNQLVIERKHTASNSTISLSSLAMSLPNSDLENESIAKHNDKAIALTNISGHEEIELLKERQLKLDEEVRVLNKLEETLTMTALLLKQGRELQEAIYSKQRQLIS
ncbi:MAG: hypothetical protein HRT54_13065 [Colwellia sp.]|nr:hypothetical protein [Colwellia sp.]